MISKRLNQKSILIFAGNYKNYGTGHIVRMSILAEFLISKRIFDVYFTSNTDETESIIVNNLGFNKINFLSFSSILPIFDICLFDSPCPNSECLEKLKCSSKKIIAFDYLNLDDRNVFAFINLFNHDSQREIKTISYLYLGLEYTIFKEEIIKAKPNLNFANKILVSIGGEDINNLTFEVLNKINSLNYPMEVTVILGVLNKNSDLIRERFGHFFNLIGTSTNFASLLSESDVVICNGGNTLLESLYIGNPTIVIPQNEMEVRFSNWIRTKAIFYKIDDIENVIEKSNNLSFRKNLIDSNSRIIDGKGKERIFEIIKKINNE